MKKAALLAALLLFCWQGSMAQSRSIFQRPPKDSTPFNNRLYKQEIGIDAWSLLWGGSSSSFVWKIRDDRSKLVPVTYSKYWRFQARIQGNNNTGYADSIFLKDVYLTRYFLEQNDYSNLENKILLLIGRERNNFYGRFNFYTGWDFGLSGGFNKLNNYWLVIVSDKDNNVVNGNNYYFAGYTARTFTMGAHAYGFAGIKYHFSERISISIEAAIGLQYYLSRRKSKLIIDEEAQALVSPAIYYHHLNSNFNYLRLLTLNYHFKKY